MNTATAFCQPYFQENFTKHLSHPIVRQANVETSEDKRMAEKETKMELLRPTGAPAKPPLLGKVLLLLSSHGFDERKIRVGYTGYGQIKTHLAEIGLVSTTPGFYNLHLGGNPLGSKLNGVYRIQIPETAVLAELNNLLTAYKITRQPGENFGAFALRKKLI